MTNGMNERMALPKDVLPPVLQSLGKELKAPKGRFGGCECVLLLYKINTRSHLMTSFYYRERVGRWALGWRDLFLENESPLSPIMTRLCPGKMKVGNRRLLFS